MRVGLALVLAAAAAPPPQAEVTAAYEAAKALVLKVTGSDVISEADLRSHSDGKEREYWLCGEVKLDRSTRFLANPSAQDLRLSVLSPGQMFKAEQLGKECHEGFQRWDRGDTVDKARIKAACENAVELGEKRQAELKFQIMWATYCSDDGIGERHPSVR